MSFQHCSNRKNYLPLKGLLDSEFSVSLLTGYLQHLCIRRAFISFSRTCFSLYVIRDFSIRRVLELWIKRRFPDECFFLLLHFDFVVIEKINSSHSMFNSNFELWLNVRKVNFSFRLLWWGHINKIKSLCSLVVWQTVLRVSKSLNDCVKYD